MTVLPLMQFVGDLFTLTPDGEALTVNAKWFQHLQEGQLGADGLFSHSEPKGDVQCTGLVLDRVYDVVRQSGDLVGVAWKHEAMLHTSQDDICCCSKCAAKGVESGPLVRSFIL